MYNWENRQYNQERLLGKMKHKLSITMEEGIILNIFDKMRQNRGQYKNKSHFIECAVKNFLGKI